MLRLGKIVVAFEGQNGAKCLLWTSKRSCSSNTPKHETHIECLLNGNSSRHIEDMYEAWLNNPASLHGSWWDDFFRNPKRGYLEAPGGPFHSVRSFSSAGSDAPQNIHETIAVLDLIRGFQVRGHHVAHLDPLGITNYSTERSPYIVAADVPNKHYGEEHVQIVKKIKKSYAPKIRNFDFVSYPKAPEVCFIKIYKPNNVGEISLDKVFTLPPTTHIGGKDTQLPLKEIISRLEHAYCRYIGVEYMHITNVGQCDWIRQKLETPGAMSYLNRDMKRLTLARLIRAVAFENFLGRKYPSVKRFGLEGGEAFIPCIKHIVDKSSLYGVETFNFGLAHRGRLNMVANVHHKDLAQIFCQFQGLDASDEGSGDVRYHLGLNVKRLNRITNKEMRLTLACNPSHLECAVPVVLGKTAAEQFYTGDTEGKKSLAIIVHGDSSISGQGVVYESMQLSDLPKYATMGTIRVVINNQLGFSTDPRHARSTPYCTAVGQMANCPIFHVNGNDVDSVIHVANIAAEWRAKFHRDVIIDIVCFRRHGHNEADDPLFTHPLMYQRIAKLKQISDIYGDQLMKEGVVKAEEMKQTKEKYEQMCEAAFTEAKKFTHVKHSDWIDTPWNGFFSGNNKNTVKPTGVSEDILKHIGKIYSSHPPASANYSLHSGFDRLFKGRTKLLEKRLIDFALGEALSFGSLLKEGVHVRLSGQDVERGAFSHRHYVLHHSKIDQTTYIPLNNLYPDQAKFIPTNSPLSEYAVLGFELGYSQMNPNALVIWECQFGDFSNTAQPMLDLFISSGQEKWVRQTGLTLFCPHGLEGMGPDHSSARPERMLQMCNDDPDVVPPDGPDFALKQLRKCNWIVSACTTPASLFHVLRRQIYLPFRKPLVVLYPKKLLRYPHARSSLDDIKENTEYLRLISDPGDPKDVKKVIFVVGKLFYDLKEAREARKLTKQIALVRIEQVSPFPYDLIKRECQKYPDANLFFAQEEHKNQGFWNYCKPRFESGLAGSREVKLLSSRPVSSAPATGFVKTFDIQLKKIIEDCIN